MMGVRSSETDDLEFAEMDPSGRYGRYNEILGKGASKTVYRAFDEYEGMEVAWNQVKLYDFLQRPEDLERLYSEIHLLKTLKHKNIMKFYTSWVDVANRRINFVTELFTSGTLRQYRQTHKRVNLRAVKNWCRQILRGLLYLHSHDPPVIHRDIKCDNIFVNGNQGEVKIGDLGLAAILRNSYAAHCVGTPEFMAPEVYQEEYNELVDIYSFGMCVLEMVTFEYPYSECTHPAQIYKKVVSGMKPEVLNRVNNDELRTFVEKCLVKVASRLSARELLKDPFLQIDDDEPAIRLPKFDQSVYDVNPRLVQPLFAIYHRNGAIFNGYSYHESENIWSHEVTGQDSNENGDFTHEDEIQSTNVAFSIRGKRKEDGEIFLRLRITDKEGRVRNIYFPFDTSIDTALSVAIEMVAELDMNDEDAAKIADMIDEEVSVLVPDWRSGPGVKEDQYPKTCNHCHSQRSSTGSFFDNRCSNTHTSLECTAMHGRFGEITYQSKGTGAEELSLHSNKSNGDSWPPHEFTDTISEGSVREASDEETGNLDESLSNVKQSSMPTLPDNYEEELQQELKLTNTKYQIQEQEQSVNFKNRVNGYIGRRRKGANVVAYCMSKFSSGKHLATCNGSVVKSGSSVLVNRSVPHSEGTQSNESSPELFTAKRYYAGAGQPYSASKGRSRRH